MFCHPARDALSQAQFQAVHNLRMAILRSSQDELLLFQHINQAGVALHQCRSKLDHASQYFVETIRRRQPDANLVQ